MQLGVAYQTMAAAAGEVFFRRTLMLASGSMSAPDAMSMAVEKVTTFAEAAGEATTTAVKGHDAVAVASAALEPYSERTEANVCDLRP